MKGFLIAYLGWGLNSMPQKYQCLFIFLLQYCVEKYLVCIMLTKRQFFLVIINSFLKSIEATMRQRKNGGGQKTMDFCRTFFRSDNLYLQAKRLALNVSNCIADDDDDDCTSQKLKRFDYRKEGIQQRQQFGSKLF